MPEDYAGASGIGTNQWTNYSNAYGTSADTTYAIASPGKNITKIGQWKNYGFSIPSTATITKVEVIPRWKVNTRESIATLKVNISRNNGTNWATEQHNTSEPTSDTDTTFDFSSPGWTWQPNMFDDGNLLVQVNASQGNITKLVSFSLNRIPVRVTYTLPEGVSQCVIIG